MRTKPEIEAIIANRLIGLHKQVITFDQLISVMQSAPQAQKDKFMQYLLTDHAAQAGEMIHKIIINKAENAAKAQASSMLADNQISIEELDKLL